MSTHNLSASTRDFNGRYLLLVVGVGLAGLGAILHDVPFPIPGSGVSGDYPVPEWNAACTSGVGQLVQSLSGSAQSDCGYIADADHAIGWLIGLGVAMLAIWVVQTVVRLARR
jgi:hypothetical protein